jgi:hypothetical protein
MARVAKFSREAATEVRDKEALPLNKSRIHIN